MNYVIIRIIFIKAVGWNGGLFGRTPAEVRIDQGALVGP